MLTTEFTRPGQRQLLSTTTPTSSLFPAVIQLSDLNGQNGFKIDGEAFHDNSGISVSVAGDINSDGFHDLLIGAEQYASDVSVTTYGAGRSYVVFGGREIGNKGVIALSSLNGSNGFKLNGEALGDRFGFKVSNGKDLNGDEHDDVIVNAIWASPNGIIDAGRTYVIFGGPGIGSSGVFNVSALNGTNGFKLDGEVSSDLSGETLAVGDVNGDSYSDLLIGAPYYANYAGRSYVVFGGPGIGSGGVLALSSLNGSNGFKIDGAASSFSGTSINAGDLRMMGEMT